MTQTQTDQLFPYMHIINGEVGYCNMSLLLPAKARKKSSEGHKSVFIPLKYINVDKKIAPVVCWLNEFQDTFTCWSCEGDKKSKPYVFFMARCPMVIEHIERIAAKASLKIERLQEQWFTANKQLAADVTTYTLRFKNQRHLEKFIKIIEEDKRIRSSPKVQIRIKKSSFRELQQIGRGIRQNRKIVYNNKKINVPNTVLALAQKRRAKK